MILYTDLDTSLKSFSTLQYNEGIRERTIVASSPVQLSIHLTNLLSGQHQSSVGSGHSFPLHLSPLPKQSN